MRMAWFEHEELRRFAAWLEYPAVRSRSLTKVFSYTQALTSISAWPFGQIIGSSDKWRVRIINNGEVTNLHEIGHCVKRLIPWWQAGEEHRVVRYVNENWTDVFLQTFLVAVFWFVLPEQLRYIKVLLTFASIAYV